MLDDDVVIDAPQWDSYLRLDHNTAIWRHLCPGAIEKAASSASGSSGGAEASAAKSRGPVNRAKLMQDVKEQVAYVLNAIMRSMSLFFREQFVNLTNQCEGQ